MSEQNERYTLDIQFASALMKPYGAITLVPVTPENIFSLKPGGWIWDDKLTERRKHERSLDYDSVVEPTGFRQIHILDLTNFGTIFNSKPFMLSTIDGYHKSEWVAFEEKRFYMLKRKD